jgi:ectoine hydroxylase-related dioxygenase (phytanoyl-CoA dioxygenase family)
MDERLAQFDHAGCAVLEGIVDPAVVIALREACEPLLMGERGPRPGVRRVLERAPKVWEIVRASPIVPLAREVAGPRANVVRSILFDKTEQTNWLVPWHQDATIAVKERVDVPGFGPWSVKDGEAHCRPPRNILDGVLVLRVHLDDVGADNGPLRVVPGSHVGGLLPAAEVDRVAGAMACVECCTKAGGVVLMRPHSVHASPKATRPMRRRVLHLEWSADELPGGLAWAEVMAER